MSSSSTASTRPICLTWELTYACNLECVHCLSSSGRRDPRELTTDEAKRVIDELHDLQVFYINIGGGEPMIRRDFFELVDYSIARGDRRQVLDQRRLHRRREAARRLTAMDYLDVQISLDGTDAATNDAVRGAGSYATARRAMDNLAGRLVELRTVQDLGRRHPPQRRPARRVQGARRLATAPSCASRACARRAAAPTRGTTCTPPTSSSARSTAGCWRTARACSPATRSSTSTPSAKPLPGLNLCGAGRVVCLIDPIGDVYACPFVIHDEFKAGNVRDAGGFDAGLEAQRAVP